MILDVLTEVSSAQALSGTVATLSDKSIPLSAAVRNREVEFNVNISSVSGTTPTIQIEVIGADDAALSSNVVSLGSVSPVIAASMAAKNIPVEVALAVKKKFIGLRYTMGGTTPACTVTASVAYNRQFQGGYDNAG